LTSAEAQQHQKVDDYIEWVIGLYSHNKSILKMDSIQRSELINILSGSSGSLRMIAINQLLFMGDLNYNEPIVLPDENLKSSKIKRVRTFDSNEDWCLKIYPNPANNYCILEFSRKSDIDASVQLIDINGKVLKNIELVKDSDLILINLNDIPTGIYLFRLNGQGVGHEVRKFVKY
jgi:hypothetical protein